jgi:hypothetical protein
MSSRNSSCAAILISFVILGSNVAVSDEFVAGPSWSFILSEGSQNPILALGQTGVFQKDMQLTGVDTERASMEGRITQPDVIEYCARQKGTGETLDHCVRETFERSSRARYHAAANCPQHLLESMRERSVEQFRLVRENGENVWKSVRTGKVLGNSCGDGTPPLLEQFKILCPTEAEALDLQ